MISVSSTRAAVPYLDPFSAHERLAEALGPERVYLLESLSGPAADRKGALVGLRPLLTLQVQRRRVALSGNRVLVAQATDNALGVGALVRTEGGLELKDRHALWDFLRAVQSVFQVEHEGGERAFSFGFFGYFGYDTAWCVEDLPELIAGDGGVPDISLVVHQATLRFDLDSQRAELVVNCAAPWGEDPAELHTLVTTAMERGPVASEGVPPVTRPLAIQDSTDQQTYCNTVPTCLEHIRLGDIYQVQLGHELTVTSEAPPGTVYRRLRARNPSPYMYLARFGEVSVIGASPELFVRIEDGLITMRPIAGTAPRGADEAEDKRIEQALTADEKERAEHIMLVDLCRNDIGRVCKTNTLDVDELIFCERYSHVVHLVSNVTGQKRDDVDAYDVIAATFPAGTMTGSPKIRAMEIIESLETSRRGIYAGALGVIDFGGYVNTALCIRTTVHRGDQYSIRASAGVVADSTPEREWRETMHKLSACYWAITGEEVADDYAGA